MTQPGKDTPSNDTPSNGSPRNGARNDENPRDETSRDDTEIKGSTETRQPRKGSRAKGSKVDEALETPQASSSPPKRRSSPRSKRESSNEAGAAASGKPSNASSKGSKSARGKVPRGSAAKDDSPADAERSEHSSEEAATLYFFPEDQVTEEAARQALAAGDRGQRAWVISHLLRYAQWDDIWTYVSRDEVREIFAELDLPENLRVAWGRMLKVEATV